MFAVAAAATVIAVASLVLTIDGVAVTAGSIDALVALLTKVAGVCLLWSSIGLGVGMVVSHQVAAIVGSLVWLFAIENLLGALAPRFSIPPGQAGMSALGIVPGDTLDPHGRGAPGRLGGGVPRGRRRAVPAARYRVIIGQGHHP